MKYTFFLIACIALFSCKQTSEAELKTPPTQQSQEVVKEELNTDLNSTSEKSVVVFEDEKFTAIYKAYLGLKASLVNTDAEKAGAAAKNMLTVVGEMYKAEDLAEQLNAIEDSKDIAQQRKAFEVLSQKFENYIAKNKITSGTIYKQYCPMAFNGKGAYWLSDSKEVRNPYFGDQMLKCGVVEKEIN